MGVYEETFRKSIENPESFWAEGLRTFGMNETIRQNIHRTSAVIMGVLSVYHVIYLSITDSFSLFSKSY